MDETLQYRKTHAILDNSIIRAEMSFTSSEN